MTFERILIPLALLGTALAGCGKSECDQVYDYVVKCEVKDGETTPSKSDFSTSCQARKSEKPDDFKAFVECTKLSSCEEAKKCGRLARLQTKLKKAQAAVAEGNWKEGLDFCEYREDAYKDSEDVRALCDKVFQEGMPALAAAGEQEEVMRTCRFSTSFKDVESLKTGCKGVAGSVMKSQLEAAVKSRNAGDRNFKLCLQIKDTAEMMGGDAKAKAEAVCAELDAGEYAHKAIKEAKANIEAKKAMVPFYCEQALDKLGKIEESDWTSKKTSEVLNACYIDLGKTIVNSELPGIKRFCPYRVKTLKEAVSKHGLGGVDAELDALLAKTEPACKS